MRSFVLPEAIATFRDRIGLSQRVLAAELKVSERHLRRLENGWAITFPLRRRLLDVARRYADTELVMVLEMTRSPKITGQFEERFSRMERRIHELERSLEETKSLTGRRGVA